MNKDNDWAPIPNSRTGEFIALSAILVGSVACVAGTVYMAIAVTIWMLG